jgi:hypothetical protein
MILIIWNRYENDERWRMVKQGLRYSASYEEMSALGRVRHRPLGLSDVIQLIDGPGTAILARLASHSHRRAHFPVTAGLLQFRQG